jgi:hypothetical protein
MSGGECALSREPLLADFPSAWRGLREAGTKGEGGLRKGQISWIVEWQ